MTHGQLINIAIGAHSAVLTLSVLAFFKYGFRSSEFRTWSEDTDKAIKNMRRKITIALGEKLKPVFDSTGRTVLSEILDASGKYSEMDVDPRQSEDYRNALFDFVENNTEEMVDYRFILLTHCGWKFWTKYLSWSILILMVLESLILVIVGGIDKLGDHSLPDWLVCRSILPTVLIVVSCFCGLCFSLFYQNRGEKYLG